MIVTCSKVLCGALVLISLFTACATVQTDQEADRIRQIAEERVGTKTFWQQSNEDQLSVQHEIDLLLADGLSKQDAVRIALINNRTLQSIFEEIGIAKSDLVQAGLITNPSLEALIRFPSGGGRTNLEAGGFLSISDFWQIPFRREIAAARMETTIMRVGVAVLKTAAEAQRAYDSVLYLSRIKEKTEEILERIQETYHQVVERRDFGLLSDQDLYLSEIALVEAEMELELTRGDLTLARTRLNRVLGLGPPQENYPVVLEPNEGPVDVPQPDEAVDYAMENRLDIQVARFKTHQAERHLSLEKTRVLRHVQAGVSYERETDGTDLIGPAIDIQIPLFDQNQARISEAEYRLRQAQKDFEALQGKVREEVLGDIERIRFLKTRVRHLRDRVIPLREKALSYAAKWVKAMQLNALSLLQAQEDLLRNHRDYLQALMKLRHAVIDLEEHLGGTLPHSY
jgi:outer membrane protein TolC